MEGFAQVLPSPWWVWADQRTLVGAAGEDGSPQTGARCPGWGRADAGLDGLLR